MFLLEYRESKLGEIWRSVEWNYLSAGLTPWKHHRGSNKDLIRSKALLNSFKYLLLGFNSVYGDYWPDKSRCFNDQAMERQARLMEQSE